MADPPKGIEAEGAALDIRAVLEASIDRPAPPDLADRVVSRLALVETVFEFARLLGIAPMSAASDAVRPDDRENEQDELEEDEQAEDDDD